MMLLGTVLAAAMGVVLGLLGGGGSILTLPILVYALGVGTKEAIATSLLVVAVTSGVGMVQHAQKGNVLWKTGALFGGFAMVGAYLAGALARFIPGEVLLGLFVVLMAVTAIFMLRKREQPVASASQKVWKIAAEGFATGAITGLVGAGGGFVVVPALVLLGGLSMRQAVGTSLMVISMKSLAGFAGYLSHVSIDYSLAGAITAAAVAGSFVGVHLSTKIESAKLKQLFGWFVLAMAAFIAYREASALGWLDSEGLRAVFSARWPWYVGGAAIGAFVLLFLLLGRKALGVSTGFEDACAAPFEREARSSWRLPFLFGILGGGALAAIFAGGYEPTAAMGLFDELFALSLPAKAAVFGGGGLLIGFGTRLAGGCTSGHGIVGTSQLAKSSLVATGVFMATGIVVTNALWALFGGA